MIFLQTDENSSGSIDKSNVCGICGSDHDVNKCSVIEVKLHVKDTPVLSKARLSLPKSLELKSMVEGVSVTAKENIEPGTKFGPFEAKKVFTPDLCVSFPLKVFHSEELFKQLYLNNSNEDECNWMYFVQPAESTIDQNLICYQEGSKIFFTSIRVIKKGEHLKVWYAPYYAKKMNKTVFQEQGNNVDEEVENIDLNQLVRRQQNVAADKVWKCKFCNLEEENIVEFAKHIKHHYTMQLYKTCEICNQKFRTLQVLEKHKVIVHWSKEATNNNCENGPNKNDINSDNQDCFGGPLLNNKYLNSENTLLDDINENYSLENTSMNLDNDYNLNINENYNLNFNLLEVSNTYTCDICLKNFSRLKLLLLHISLHTGEFTCNKCHKVFSRKESLLNHTLCNVGEVTLLKCDQCDKTFKIKKNLMCHKRLQHDQDKFFCKTGCKKRFSTEEDADKHICPLKLVLNCKSCNKVFSSQKYYKQHLKTHSKDADTLLYICEICPNSFSSKKLLDQHQLSHKNENYTCKTCNKSFKWKSTFIEHLETHQTEILHLCEICNTTFKTRKYLLNHMFNHNKQLPHHCQKCPQKFKLKSNLERHMKRNHNKKCPKCDLIFEDIEIFKEHYRSHLKNSFKCPICDHSVKLKSSLFRHIKNKHSHLNINYKDIDNQAIQVVNRKNKSDNLSEMEIQSPLNKSDSNSDDIDKLLGLKETEMGEADIYTNLEYIVNSYEESTNIIAFNPEQERLLDDKNMEENILDFKCLQMDFDNCNNQDLSLSMPLFSSN